MAWHSRVLANVDEYLEAERFCCPIPFGDSWSLSLFPTCDDRAFPRRRL